MSTDRQRVVLKLGGSVITDKDTPETVDEAALERVADAVAASLETGAIDLVLVHGGGSFGHHHASAHGVSTTAGTHDAAAALAIHEAMKRLNAAVLAALRERDVPALPVHPFSAASRDADGETDVPSAQLETMLGEGFVPVLHGDGVVQAGEGVTVLSGDELVTTLARSLAADRVGLCSTVPGVLDTAGEVVPRIEHYDEVASALGESESTDVTGGMAAKVRTLLELEAAASVFGPDDLAAFLEGARPGTTIE
ncbi:isopentenyl phosphate kinase [Natronobiforma cellulositropha]|uniref:isopentenyl phosphate kinase n=1 Tax=Natronobiforma cellulositropha TaxID=1679076 RepID=UPI0021D57958|nr:isopentenyl phosphate kinase [Natronobiforma cellulositropha]